MSNSLRKFLQLHEELSVSYTVDGWRADLSTCDGRIVAASAWSGQGPEAAIALLAQHVRGKFADVDAMRRDAMPLCGADLADHERPVMP